MKYLDDQTVPGPRTGTPGRFARALAAAQP